MCISWVGIKKTEIFSLVHCDKERKATEIKNSRRRERKWKTLKISAAAKSIVIRTRLSNQHKALIHRLIYELVLFRQHNVIYFSFTGCIGNTLWTIFILLVLQIQNNKRGALRIPLIIIIYPLLFLQNVKYLHFK